MPFQNPFAINDPAYPNAEQPTINVGHIAGAINVQGGGELLLHTTGTIASNAGIAQTSFDIPAPRSGITYYGLGVIVRNVSKTAIDDVPLWCSVYNFGTAAPISTDFMAGIVANNALELGTFGFPEITSVVMPVATTFPIQMTIRNQAFAGSMNYDVMVIGLSQADVVARDFGIWGTGLDVATVFDNCAIDSYATIAASFETRDFILSAGATAGGNWIVQVLDNNGTWTTSQLRAHVQIYGGKITGPTLSTDAASIITIPGNGAIHKVRTISTPGAGSQIRLSYLGKR